MRSCHRIGVLVTLLVLTWIGPTSAGERRAGYVYTVEWLVADADVVVRARIDDAPITKTGSWDKAKARSIETLKGSLPDEFDFAVLKSRGLLARFRGHQVLLVLNKSGRHAALDGIPAGCDLVLARDHPYWSVIDLDDGADDFVVTMGLSILTRPDQIMGAARDAATYSRSRPKSGSYKIIGIPYKSGIDERMNGSTLPGIYLPRDERLEATARELIRSDNPFVRVEGIIILGRFRSEENIAIAKALLTDPAFNGGRYPVREAARNRLSQWKISVDEPAR